MFNCNKTGFPLMNMGTTKAGIKVRLDQPEGEEPIDVTLYIKKPKNAEEAQPAEGGNSFTAAGKLTFRFGKKGSVELFAENAVLIDETPPTVTVS